MSLNKFLKWTPCFEAYTPHTHTHTHTHTHKAEKETLQSQTITHSPSCSLTLPNTHTCTHQTKRERREEHKETCSYHINDGGVAPVSTSKGTSTAERMLKEDLERSGRCEVSERGEAFPAKTNSCLFCIFNFVTWVRRASPSSGQSSCKLYPSIKCKEESI